MQSEFKPPSRRVMGRIHELLRERYGTRTPLKRDPLDGLVLIILSQATNDINCDRAFSSLQAAFATWDDVLAAPVDSIADAIRQGGLANQKAARIQRILSEIKAEHGSLDLSWMQDASSEECVAYLSRFHGVGPKTIACVLVFFLGKPAFPVDTHVHRVTRRLGWVRPKAGAEETQRTLEALLPDAWKLDLHVNLISHGRAICRAEGNGGPQCGACFLRPHCVYGKAFGQNAPAGSGPDKTLTPRQDFFITLEVPSAEASN